MTPCSLIKLADAATLLNVSRTRIYELAKADAIPGVVRFGKRQLRIDRVKLEAFIERGGNTP